MIAEHLTKNQIIEIYKEAGKPLAANTIADLMEIDDKGYGFTMLDSQCRICNYKSIIICPSCCDLDNLECGNCGNFTAGERELKDWE